MSGNKIALDLLKAQSDVYFYKPPSQEEALRLGRKAKHCQHYHGPAKIVKKIGQHSYEISYQGRTYQRDQGMLIPAQHRARIVARPGQGDTFPPANHTPANLPLEGEFVLLKDSPSSPDWYCAQIEEVLVDRIKVIYCTTTAPPVQGYATAFLRSRRTSITAARYLRTWTRNGAPTTSPPRTSRLYSRLYTGLIPMNELHDHLLILAAALSRPHRQGAGGEDSYIYN